MRRNCPRGILIVHQSIQYHLRLHNISTRVNMSKDVSISRKIWKVFCMHNHIIGWMDHTSTKAQYPITLYDYILRSTFHIHLYSIPIHHVIEKRGVQRPGTLSFGVKTFQSFWNLAGGLATVLPNRQPNCTGLKKSKLKSHGSETSRDPMICALTGKINKPPWTDFSIQS